MVAAKHSVQWICLVVFLLVVSGCKAPYQQAVGTNGATIRTATRADFISAVDNVSTADTANRAIQGFMTLSGAGVPVGTHEVTVTPGKHTIKVQTYYARAELWLIAEPCGQYIIQSDKTEHGQAIWIEEEETGESVGGVKGSLDEPPDEATTEADKVR